MDENPSRASTSTLTYWPGEDPALRLIQELRSAHRREAAVSMLRSGDFEGLTRLLVVEELVRLDGILQTEGRPGLDDVHGWHLADVDTDPAELAGLVVDHAVTSTTNVLIATRRGLAIHYEMDTDGYRSELARTGVPASVEEVEDMINGSGVMYDLSQQELPDDHEGWIFDSETYPTLSKRMSRDQASARVQARRDDLHVISCADLDG